MHWVEGAAPRETGQTQWDEFHYLAKVMVAVRVPSSHSKFWLQLGRWTRSSLRTVLLTQQLPITGTMDEGCRQRFHGTSGEPNDNRSPVLRRLGQRRLSVRRWRERSHAGEPAEPRLSTQCFEHFLGSVDSAVVADMNGGLR
jgi:hypothetical protein